MCSISMTMFLISTILGVVDLQANTIHAQKYQPLDHTLVPDLKNKENLPVGMVFNQLEQATYMDSFCFKQGLNELSEPNFIYIHQPYMTQSIGVRALVTYEDYLKFQNIVTECFPILSRDTKSISLSNTQAQKEIMARNDVFTVVLYAIQSKSIAFIDQQKPRYADDALEILSLESLDPAQRKKLFREYCGDSYVDQVLFGSWVTSSYDFELSPEDRKQGKKPIDVANKIEGIMLKMMNMAMDKGEEPSQEQLEYLQIRKRGVRVSSCPVLSNLGVYALNFDFRMILDYVSNSEICTTFDNCASFLGASVPYHIPESYPAETQPTDLFFDISFRKEGMFYWSQLNHKLFSLVDSASRIYLTSCLQDPKRIASTCIQQRDKDFQVVDKQVAELSSLSIQEWKNCQDVDRNATCQWPKYNMTDTGEVKYIQLDQLAKTIDLYCVYQSLPADACEKDIEGADCRQVGCSTINNDPTALIPLILLLLVLFCRRKDRI